MAMRDPAPSPLDVLETTFRLLTTDPEPLALDGATLGCGLPARLIALDELRSILLHPSTSFAARDAALAALVGRAQAHGGGWTVGLAGVLLPGLRRVAGHLAREFPGDTADIDAEVLTGFLEALVRRLPLEATSVVPPPPVGHPDILLARAVRHGVLAAWEAELIGATRLEGEDLLRIAADGGYKPDTLRHWRRAAERRLAAWLLTGSVPVPPVSGERSPPPGRAARPRSASASDRLPGPPKRAGRGARTARRSTAASLRHWPQARRPSTSSVPPNSPPESTGNRMGGS